MKVRSLNSGGGGGGSCCEGVSMSSLLSLAVLLYVVLFAESAEGKVRCYVCSWHSPAHGGQNMTDTCSHYNFAEEYTRTITCDSGCEAVSIRKSKNENIINFYKNCKQSTSTRDECTSTEDKNLGYVTTCECSSDLCNSAEHSGKIKETFFTSFLLAVYYVLVSKQN